MDGVAGLVALLVLLAALVVWIVLAVRALLANARSRAVAARALADADFFGLIAEAAPGGFLHIAADGLCRIGGAASAWLGPCDGSPPGARLSPESAHAFKRLLADKAAGPIEVETIDGRRLRACRCDSRLPADRSGETLVWFEDRSAELARVEQVFEESRALGRAAESLRAILEAAPFPIWMRDGDLALIAVNDAYVRAVEQSGEAAVIAHQVEIVANALTGSTREMARRTRASGGVVSERHFAVVAGQRCALDITNIALDNHIVGFAIDVTEAESARAELARVIDGHAETLNRLSTPVAIFDAEQRLRFFNNPFARLFRLSEDWLAEHPDHGSLIEAMRERRRLPEQADFRSWKANQLALHHSLEPVEEMWHLPDGSTLRVVAQPHALGGLLILYEDVTSRLALESSYNTLIAVQRETLNNLHEAVAVFGSDARLKLFNPDYARIWGLDPDFLATEPHFGEILDHSNMHDHAGKLWPELRARLLGQVAGRKAISGRWNRPDGVVLDYAVVPLPDGRTLTTHLDVSDSSRIEQALRERNEALETADRMKSEFVASMSYELRTPLNSIIGFTELLNAGFAGPLTGKQQGYAGYVLEAAGQLRELIDDILDLAVIEAGGMTLDVVAVPVLSLVENACTLAREQARKAELKLEIEVDAACGEIEGDARRLTQALYNLLTNAIKFTPPGGKVTVRARPEGDDQVEVAVIDDGVGVDDEERERVFKKFHTGPKAGSRKGVGLGLSLVQSFITLHQGHVVLESAPGRGTSVICRLPRRQGMVRDR